VSKIGIIIQARTGSTRLPGKMLMPFYQHSLLIDIILQKFETISRSIPVVLATTTNKKDDALEEYASKYNVFCYRGSEDDVLQRFIGAAKKYDIDVVIRVCADNPFLSVELINNLIDSYHLKKYNYISYNNSQGLPTIRTHYGFFAELVELPTLEKIVEQTQDKFYHEHVTNFIYENRDSFTLNLLKLPFPENDNIRLTIDTINDFEIAREIYAHLKNTYSDTEPVTVIDYLNENKKYFDLMNDQIKQQKK
jgi:spore coat polysaccharide biosynthesis protein SpsF (cytidylyltransferase family)